MEVEEKYKEKCPKFIQNYTRKWKFESNDPSPTPNALNTPLNLPLMFVHDDI